MNTEFFFEKLQQDILLSDIEKDYLKSVLKSRTFLKRQFVLQQGDVCRYLTFINKGCVRSFMIDHKGCDFNLRFATEGEWIGDFCSLFNGKPSAQNIEALEKTEALQLPKEELDRLHLKIPQFEHFYRILLQKAFITHEKRVLYFISKSAKDRYLAFREYYGKLEQRIPQHYIASYIGVTPEFLSKIRKQISTAEKKS